MLRTTMLEPVAGQDTAFQFFLVPYCLDDGGLAGIATCHGDSFVAAMGMENHCVVTACRSFSPA
jgi:hypothetical protein